MSCLRLNVGLLLLCLSTIGHSSPVLMISVDGLKPEYVLGAPERGLKIPFLRSLMAEGSYAEGVIGVWPTITYPSHTTLVTGVSPAVHGIYSNLEFDPYHRFKDSWFWYAGQIRVQTLWQAAHEKGIPTASVGWPVTVGATGIDYLIPEYWRITGSTDTLNPSDRDLVAALSLPTGLLTLMQKSLGPYLQGNDTSREGDEIKTIYSLELLRRYKPKFMTLHLSSLDDAQHAHGVFSPEAGDALEAIDGMLDRLARAARFSDPATVVAVVSDHGFAPVTRRINLFVPFIQSGLMTLTEDSRALTIHSWRAQPWFAGGMAAVMLRDPQDKVTERVVAAMLRRLQADGNNGIAAIEDRQGLIKRGGFPDAAFLVIFKPGYYAGLGWTGALIENIDGTHGGHGFSPDDADMRAAFFISGEGIAHHRDLGVIDMRQVAPTIAQLLGVRLPKARNAPLPIDE